METQKSSVVIDDSDIHRLDASATSKNSYQVLRGLVRVSGLLGRRPGFYALTISYVFIASAAGWGVFFALGNSWWQMPIAAYLGFWAVHIGFLAHDAGHRQISHNEYINAAIGLVHANLFLGMSYGWWVNHHSRHHSEPNHLERDPDITRRKAIFHVSQAQERRGFARFVARNQGWVFFLLKPLEALGLRISSARAIWKAQVRRPLLEGSLLLVHTSLFLATVFYVLPIQQAIFFLLVHQSVFGFYLGIAFATNHKGMPVRRDACGWTFLEKQVLTSRNLPESRVLTFLYGGLNYQIEHHLFPTMARPNLHEVVPIVKRFCSENNIPYEETSVLQTYADILRSLDAVSRAVDWNHAPPSTSSAKTTSFPTK